MSWRRGTVTSGDVRLPVRDSGAQGRQPLLLIHGLGLTQRSWARVAGRLTKRFRVVTYDQRGHGASSPARDYSRSAFLQDLAAVIEMLGLQDAVLVGHSLGGHLAVEYAASHPDCASEVGIEGGIPVDLPAADSTWIEARGRKPLATLSMAVGKLLRLGSSLSSEDMNRLVEENEPWLRGLGAAYDRISCPVLLLVGSTPDRVPQGVEIREAVRHGVHELQGAHPGVMVEWLSCGHFAQLERPAEVAASIDRFIGAME